MSTTGRPARAAQHGRKGAPPLPGQTLGGNLRAPVGAVPSVRPEETDDEETVAYDARSTSPSLVPRLRPPPGVKPSRTTVRGMQAAVRAEIVVPSNVPKLESVRSDSDIELQPVEGISSSGSMPARRLPAYLTETAEPERDFSNHVPAPARESMPPFALVSQSPSPRPSLVRSLFVKLFFLAILSATIALLAYEGSILLHMPWLDPRPLLAKVAKFVIEHAPVRKLLP